MAYVVATEDYKRYLDVNLTEVWQVFKQLWSQKYINHNLSGYVDVTVLACIWVVLVSLWLILRSMSVGTIINLLIGVKFNQVLLRSAHLILICLSTSFEKQSVVFWFCRLNCCHKIVIMMGKSMVWCSCVLPAPPWIYEPISQSRHAGQQ